MENRCGWHWQGQLGTASGVTFGIGEQRPAVRAAYALCAPCSSGSCSLTFTAETLTLAGVRPQILPFYLLSLQIATAGTKDSPCPHLHGLFDHASDSASLLGQFLCEQDMQHCVLGKLGLLGVLSP